MRLRMLMLMLMLMQMLMLMLMMPAETDFGAILGRSGDARASKIHAFPKENHTFPRNQLLRCDALQKSSR